MQNTQSLTGPIELSNCDKEPVHIPGAIQSYGVLIACDLDSGRVQAASQSMHSLFGIDPASLLGRSLFEINELQDLGIADFRHSHSWQDQVDGHKLLARTIAAQNQQWWLTAHKNVSWIIFEWEPLVHSGEITPSNLIGDLFISLDKTDLTAGYQVVTQQIQQFTGFDRVMLYQFHDDLHGSVIAETCHHDQEPFLGLHYPASDIPLPARRLYELNWVRGIADVAAEPASLISNSDTPIDLSYSRLRAVSSIHVEYLRNMQVGSSMSISVMSGHQLWGLIACHHREPKFISPVVRDACELCGTVLSSFLTSRRQAEYLKLQVQHNDKIAQQLTTLSQYNSFAEGLERVAPALTQMLAANGLVYVGETNFYWGEVPNESAINDIVTRLTTEQDSEIVHTEELGRWLPSATRYADRCTGLLALRLGKHSGHHLMLFRPPVAQQITWAGNPHKATGNDNARLTPRKSFEAWQQSVEGRSTPWTAADLQLARSLAMNLQSVIAEQSARLMRANEELQQLNGDLDAFAYAASHDLKEPLRGIHHYAYLLEQAETQGTEYQSALSGLKRIVRRMDDLLDGLLRFSRAGRAELLIEDFSLNDALAQAIDILFAGRIPDGVTVRVAQDGLVRGDYACVREVLANLISNGLKYNSSEEKVVELSVVRAAQTPLAALTGDRLAIKVSDNGIGVDRKYHQQIFEIFQRLHDRDAFGGGSGAGLTIARRIVERHGGKIALESSANGGTTFYFSLGDSK